MGNRVGGGERLGGPPDAKRHGLKAYPRVRVKRAAGALVKPGLDPSLIQHGNYHQKECEEREDGARPRPWRIGQTNKPLEGIHAIGMLSYPCPRIKRRGRLQGGCRFCLDSNCNNLRSGELEVSNIYALATLFLYCAEPGHPGAGEQVLVVYEGYGEAKPETPVEGVTGLSLWHYALGRGREILPRPSGQEHTFDLILTGSSTATSRRTWRAA